MILGNYDKKNPAKEEGVSFFRKEPFVFFLGSTKCGRLVFLTFSYKVMTSNSCTYLYHFNLTIYLSYFLVYLQCYKGVTGPPLKFIVLIFLLFVCITPTQIIHISLDTVYREVILTAPCQWCVYYIKCMKLFSAAK